MGALRRPDPWPRPDRRAALNGASVKTSLVLLAYALGAATSLGLALLTCGRVLAVLKRSLSAGEWLRRGIGVAVLAGVAFVTTGWDTQLLSQMSFANTTSIEETLINWTGAHPAAVSKKAAIEGAASIGFGVFDRQSWVSPAARRVTALALIDIVFKETSMAPADAGPVTKVAAATKADLPVEGRLPGFSGAVEWLNSAPLTPQALRGKVVLVISSIQRAASVITISASTITKIQSASSSNSWKRPAIATYRAAS